MAYLLVKVKINIMVEGGTLRVLAVTPSYPRFWRDYHVNSSKTGIQDSLDMWISEF